jgi:hypothetical protein
VREGDRDFIRHHEADRFRFNAREVKVERRVNDTITVVRHRPAKAFTAAVELRSY